MRRVRIRTLLGVLAVGLGVAALADVGLVGAFHTGEILVPAVGLVAVVVGAFYALGRRRTTRDATNVDPPEPRYRSAVPGADVDATLRGRHGAGLDAAAVRERLEATVVEALVVREGYDRSAARAAVEEGTWTDDPVAAEYLATGAVPLRLSVPSFVNREPVIGPCVRRTVAALEEVGEP